MTAIAALHHHAGTNPNGVAFINGDDTWTYKRLAGQAERVADGLVRRGVRRGDRVALHMPNRPELAVALYACFHIGAIAVPLNNRLKTAEMRPLLKRLQHALYVGEAELYSQVSAIESSILPPERRFVAGSTRRSRLSPAPWCEDSMRASGGCAANHGLRRTTG
jgi:long-chain acyl-CoA synthetase